MILPPEPSDHLRIVAVIQARMGSSRLPGKVLKPIAGKPLLWHVIEKLKKSSLIEAIAVATSTNPLDDAIVSFAREQGIAVVRGPEENVLARFARAAELMDADIIVRVSADAPFLDAGFIDHLVVSLIEQNADYVLLEDGAITAHEGVDPLTRRALDKLMMDASEDPVAREHVTGYFKLHPDFVRIARAPAYAPLARKAGRLTVDTPDDLAFMEAVYERLHARAGEASLADLLFLLDREPGLRKLNAHVSQKGLQASGRLALIRCDGGGGFGYGHVKRMVALARSLRDREGIGAQFAVNGSEDALLPISGAGFEARLVGQDAPALQAMVRQSAPDILICDMREGFDAVGLRSIAEEVSLTAVIDDASDRRLAADVAYYPPVPQASELVWPGSHCAPRIGWQWVLLGMRSVAPVARVADRRLTLLVCMGGSDPAGLTLRAAEALRERDPSLRVRFVIGPGMADGERIARRIAALSANFETVEGASDLSAEYGSSDLALCSFGVTACELAAFGVPAVYLCLTEDHERSASAFEKAGMGLSLGLAHRAGDVEIASAVHALLENPSRRHQMHAAGLALIDGEGANRIAADLARALAARRAAPLRAANG